jgi:hypothetical protein
VCLEYIYCGLYVFIIKLNMRFSLSEEVSFICCFSLLRLYIICNWSFPFDGEYFYRHIKINPATLNYILNLI